MQIDLTDVLSERHIPIIKDIPCEMEKMVILGNAFSIRDKSPIHLEITYEKGNVLNICGKVELTLLVPCDRCLKEVTVRKKLRFQEKVDLADSVAGKRYDETSDVDGQLLDMDKLLYKELLVDWPEKVLCKPDCRGICSVCGQDLNEKTCHCTHEEQLDPRMSVIRDLFQKSKEV